MKSIRKRIPVLGAREREGALPKDSAQSWLVVMNISEVEAERRPVRLEHGQQRVGQYY